MMFQDLGMQMSSTGPLEGKLKALSPNELN
jgi:hypothetical protein